MGTKVCSLSSFSSGHLLFFSLQSALLHKSLSPSKTLKSERPTPILPFIHSLPLPPSPHNHLHSSPRPPLTPTPPPGVSLVFTPRGRTSWEQWDQAANGLLRFFQARAVEQKDGFGLIFVLWADGAKDAVGFGTLSPWDGQIGTA